MGNDGWEIERQEVRQLVLNKINSCFSPTDEEMEIIENSLNQYNEEELKCFEANFTAFGVDEVVKCLYGLKFGDL